jgi:hypothetical protein
MLGTQSKAAMPMWGFFYIPRVTRDSGLFVTDRKGYIFRELFRVLADEKGIRLPPLVLKHPDEAANEYIRNYDMVAILRDTEGTVVCYSVEYRNKLPQAFTDRLRTYLGLMPDSTVLWSDDIDHEPQEEPAREVIYGQKPEPPPKKPTRAQMRAKWAHPSELTQAQLDYLMGRTDEPPPDMP